MYAGALFAPYSHQESILCSGAEMGKDTDFFKREMVCFGKNGKKFTISHLPLLLGLKGEGFCRFGAVFHESRWVRKEKKWLFCAF